MINFKQQNCFSLKVYAHVCVLQLIGTIMVWLFLNYFCYFEFYYQGEGRAESSQSQAQTKKKAFFF